jgi:azurin
MKKNNYWLFILIFLISFDNPEEIRTIEINAVSGMQYDLVRFKVKPNEKLKITLHNLDEMTHNWLLVKPGTREVIVSKALQLPDGEAANYIPDDSNILQAIPLLNPDQSFTITFTAPEKEGVYPYVCTYPGHGSVMYGAMYVTYNMLPPLASDQNIPEKRRESDEATEQKASGHPYNMILPSMYRAFMPQSGPASIAVGMLGDISYCWDAGQCRLRYAWKGGFVDMERTWSGKGKEKTDIVGVVFYREEIDYPLKLGKGKEIPKVKFKGYRMKNRYPTFLYTINEAEVEERILPTFDYPGIKRIFKFKNLHVPVWINIPEKEGISFTVNQGEITREGIYLTPEEAREFIITIKESGKVEEI